jgi:Ca-activated chloride channel homolog
MRTRPVCSLLAFICLVGWLTSTQGWADGLIVIREPLPFPPGPRPIPHYAFAPLEVTYHHVTVKITDQVAVTTVDQSFNNPNDQRLEGTYLFPIPKGGQIDKFTMDINGKSVDAELLDADKARKIYEDIVRKMKDPALLEYAGQGLFKVRIFPIEPRSEKRIQLKYTQLLRSESGMVEYVYPLNTEKFSSQPLKSVSVKVDLESKQPIKTLYSPSHKVEIKREGDNKAVIGYEAANVKPDTDFHLLFSRDAKADVGLNLLTYQDGSEAEGYFALFASPSAEMTQDKIVEKDIVFVLDTSGSMADNDKIEQAKKALLFCLKNLNKSDRFELVRFSTEADALFGKLAEADKAAREKAEEYVKGLKPMGGTALEDALIKAVQPAKSQAQKDRPYLVVFLTDGLPTVGNTDEDTIVSNVTQSVGERTVRIFCFGIGTDVNTHLLDKITEKTRAASQYVLPSEDLELKVSNFYAKINDPALAGLKISFGGALKPAKMYPPELPDLFKGEQLVAFGRYTGAGATAITLEGTVNGKPRSFTTETKVPEKATEAAFIPRMWAIRRVGFLLDQIRLHGDSKELRDEVSDLARRYGIVTPYTAYLIVEDEKQRNVPAEASVMRAVTADSTASAATKAMFQEARKDKSGEAAVGGAQAFSALRLADNAEAPAAASFYGYRGQTGGAAADAGKVESALQTQKARFAGGRTFYRNGAQWVDALVQAHLGATKKQVTFGSDEYFALLAKHPEAGPWLAVGQSVQVWLDDAIVEITE